jgi:uncharacterized protein YegL
MGEAPQPLIDKALRLIERLFPGYKAQLHILKELAADPKTSTFYKWFRIAVATTSLVGLELAQPMQRFLEELGTLTLILSRWARFLFLALVVVWLSGSFRAPVPPDPPPVVETPPAPCSASAEIHTEAAYGQEQLAFSLTQPTQNVSFQLFLPVMARAANTTAPATQALVPTTSSLPTVIVARSATPVALQPTAITPVALQPTALTPGLPTSAAVEPGATAPSTPDDTSELPLNPSPAHAATHTPAPTLPAPGMSPWPTPSTTLPILVEPLEPSTPPSATPTPWSTYTAVPSATPTEAPSAPTATATSIPPPSATFTATASPTATPTATPTTSPTATASPTATPTATPTPSPTATATESPAPTTEPCSSVLLPLDVMLVLDRSGSMAEGDAISAMRAAAGGFVELLRPSNDRVGLVSFNDTATVLGALSTDFANVRTAIDGLSAEGGTNIASGLELAYATLNTDNRSPAARPVIVLLTDGQNRADEELLRQIAEKARRQEIRVITVGLGSEINEGLLASLAYSAEDAYLAPSAADLAAIYRSIAIELTCRTETAP